jgi:hypothetical protein
VDGDGGSLVARWAAIYEDRQPDRVLLLLDAAPAGVTATDGSALAVAAAPAEGIRAGADG